MVPRRITFSMNITKTDIARAIGNPAYFSRGAAYYSGRKVLSAQADGTDRISGAVSGSGGRAYRVDVHLQRTADGGLSAVDGHCSCPVGYNCKHVVAILLEASQRAIEYLPEPAISRVTEHTEPSVKARLPGTILSWFDTLTTPEGTSPPPLRSKNSSNEMFYVFRRSLYNRAEIVPVKAYVKKDGTIGKNIQEHHGRYDLSHAPGGTTLEDAIIFAQLGYFSTNTYPSQFNWPQGEPLGTLLQQIVATGRARASDIHGPTLKWFEPKQVKFQWDIDDQGDQRLSARDDAGRQLVLLPFPDPVFIDENAGTIGFAETCLPSGIATALVAAPTVPAETVAAVAEVLAKHANAAPRPNPVEVHVRTDQVPSIRLTLFGHERRERSYSRGWTNRDSLQQKVIYPCIRAQIRYEGCDELLEPGNGPDIRHTSGSGVSIVRRDLQVEMKLLDQLEVIAQDYEGYHPDLAEIYGQIPKKMKEAHVVFPQILPEESQYTSPVLAFTAEGIPQLRDLGWEIEIDPSWPFRLHSGDVSFRTVLEPSENDWFSLGLKLDVDGTALDLTPTILQILASLPLDETGEFPAGFDLESFLSEIVLYQQLPNGILVPLPGPRLTGFVEAFLEAQGLTRFHKAEAARVGDLAKALEGCGAPWDGGAEVLALGNRMRRLATLSEEDTPPSLKAELRPYQQVGYGWLKALSESGFGGILADDMGLGKTVQALALLVHRHLEVKTDRPSLLVVPTSLIGNWQNEAARFAPDLKLLILHGPDRHERFAQISDNDLIITTYPLINRDHEVLFEHEFDLAILDEAQAVKNPTASVAKRIRQIKARQRIALTGTPLENNLTELWSLFDWLIPGLLGNRKSFASEYRRPIEQLGDRSRQRLLSTRIKPFLLRRTKDEVASDLPPKTIIDEMVTLTGPQAALYESVRTAMDARVREAVDAKGLAGSRITVLDALLKLRQVCCDPKLVKLDAAAKVKDSAKRHRLMEILEELMSENRKVLVFSQFVEMLRLIEGEVQQRGWSYAMLHGKTRDRTGEIEKFQSGQAELFLISLKAGGTGLNLTAADTVILYDPWWNPAVERQAMDRAHRIGQDKPVFVHRFYAAGTVETAIQAMQAQKQALADALFEGTAGGPMALTEDDLEELFSSK